MIGARSTRLVSSLPYSGPGLRSLPLCLTCPERPQCLTASMESSNNRVGDPVPRANRSRFSRRRTNRIGCRFLPVLTCAVDSTDHLYLWIPLGGAVAIGILRILIPLGEYQLTRLPTDAVLAGMYWDVWALTQITRSDNVVLSDHAPMLVGSVIFIHFALFALFAQLSERAREWKRCLCEGCTATGEIGSSYCSNCGNAVDPRSGPTGRWKVAILETAGVPFSTGATFAVPVMVAIGLKMPF